MAAHTYFDHHFTAVEGEPTGDQIACAADAVMALAGVPSPASVLDLGCGTGFLSVELARRGYRVVGVDRSARLVATARKLAGPAARDLQFVVADAGTLGTRFASDVVVAWGGLLGYGALRADAALVRTAATLVQPGGTLIVSLFNPRFLAGGGAINCSYSARRRLVRARIVRPGCGEWTLQVGVRTVAELRRWIGPRLGPPEVVGWDGWSTARLGKGTSLAPRRCRFLLFVAKADLSASSRSTGRRTWAGRTTRRAT